MKKLLIIALTAVAIAIPVSSVFATGAEGINPPQQGTLSFTATTGQNITNSFPFPFQTIPIVTFSATTTNATPLTNNFVNITNFSLSVATTNVIVNWTAVPGYTRIQYGTNAVQAQFLLTNTFPVPYAYPPVVFVQGTALATNGSALTIGVTNLTSTGFVTFMANTNQFILWQAVGTCASPGPNTVTY